MHGVCCNVNEDEDVKMTKMHSLVNAVLIVFVGTWSWYCMLCMNCVYVCVCISLSLGIIPPTIMCQNIKLHYFWHSMSLQFHTFDWKFNLHVSYDDFFHCHCSENCICFHGSFTLTHNQICTFYMCEPPSAHSIQNNLAMNWPIFKVHSFDLPCIST